MAAFEYIALNEKGKQQKGVLEGDSARQVRQQLRDKGWMPISVDITKAKSKSGSFLKRGPGLSMPELALLTRQLATLIGAGLPIDESLKALSEQTDKQKIQSMILVIRAKVLEGYTLAKALAEYPRAFPRLYRSTVSAGEHAGHLDGVLLRLAEYTESRQAADQQIKLAAIYPIILTVVAIGIVIGLLTYVVPDIVQVFVKNGQTLPFLTQVMLDISHLITDFGLYALLLSVLLFIAFLFALRRTEFRKKYHQFLLKLPVFGGFIKDANTARYSSTLAILTSSGVPLVEAMRIASEVVNNIPIGESLTKATIEVSEGGSLNSALKSTGYFSPILIHMVASGEASGELDSMLAKTAKQQEEGLSNTISALVKTFEPVMLLTMGAIVALIVAAIMMPILELQKMIN